MIYLLFTSLLFILLIDILIRGLDILRPSSWVTLGFLLGSFFGVLNKYKWGDISFVTYILIILFVVLFSLFSSLGEKMRLINLPSIKIEKKYPKYLVLIINIIMLISGIMYFQFIYNNAILGGSNGSLSAIFSYARQAEQMGIAKDPSFILSLLMVFSFSFGYIQTFIIIRDLVLFSVKYVRLCDIITVILYFSHTIVSGGRTRLMYFIIYIIVVGLIMYRNKNHWSKKSINIAVKYIILGFLIVVMAFWLIENTVRGSVFGNSYSIWYQLSKYIGSPIYALNIYLENPFYMNSFYETETMYSIISILNKLGMGIPFNNNALEFVTYSSGSNQIITNIYTALRRYLHDFKLPGLIILISLQSLIYSSLYANIKKNRTENSGLLYYGIIIYPVAFYFIEERFLNDLFTLTMILQYMIIYFFLILLNLIGINKRENKKWRVII
jgi:oligosaccharide repeat unit polymerase